MKFKQFFSFLNKETTPKHPVSIIIEAQKQKLEEETNRFLSSNEVSEFISMSICKSHTDNSKFHLEKHDYKYTILIIFIPK